MPFISLLSPSPPKLITAIFRLYLPLQLPQTLSIMPISMGNILKSPYELKDLLNQVYTALKIHLYLLHALSHDILVCFIGFAIH